MLGKKKEIRTDAKKLRALVWEFLKKWDLAFCVGNLGFSTMSEWETGCWSKFLGYGDGAKGITFAGPGVTVAVSILSTL